MEAVLLLAVVAWVSHFSLSSDFGLYLDDFWRVSVILEEDFSSVLNKVFRTFTTIGQGRPLHDASILSFSWAGFHLAGLPGIYWIGYLLFTLNCVLFYLLLRRTGLESGAALAGGLIFSLSPQYTTQAWITASFGIQPSLTLLLIALHTWLSSRHWWAYASIFATLLFYETLFLPFLAAPLLVSGRQRQSPWLRRIPGHVVPPALMLVAVFALRVASGEGRISSQPPLDLIVTSLRHTLTGPLISMATCLYRPMQVVKALDGKLVVLILPVLFALLLFMYRHLIHSKGAETTSRPDLLRLSLAGLLMLILVYPLTLIGVVEVVNGPQTRIHTASSVGFSILFTSLFSALLSLLEMFGKRRWALFPLALFFTLLLGFGFLVQRDYRSSWESQRAFWSDIVRLCPDLEDGTLILVDSKAVQDPRQMVANG